MITFLLIYYILIPFSIAILLTLLSLNKGNIFHIITTWFIWWYSYATLIPISLIVVPIALKRGWEGYSTIFGNYKYGRYGNNAALSKTFLDEVIFLTIRNPISNFGKHILSVSSFSTWPWNYDIPLFSKLWLKCGWKLVKNPEENPERTFFFRPYIKDNND